MSADVTNDRAASNIFSAFFKGLRNYFNFRGRTCRYDYWAYTFVFCLVSVLFNIAALYAPDFMIVSSIFSLLLIFPTWAILVRRLHDVNKSFFKCFVLPLIIVFLLQYALKFVSAVDPSLKLSILLAMQMGLSVWFFVVFIFTCKKGKSEDNKYGKAVIEDESHDKRVGWMLFFFILFILFFILSAIFSFALLDKKMGEFESTVESTVKQLQSNVDKGNLEYQRILSERNDVEEDEVQEEDFEARETEANE